MLVYQGVDTSLAFDEIGIIKAIKVTFTIFKFSTLKITLISVVNINLLFFTLVMRTDF